VAAVEFGEGGGGEAVFADGVEEVEEAAVLLAVDLGELDAGVVGFAEGAAAEEIGRVVEVREQRPIRASFTTGESCCRSPIIRSWTPPKGLRRSR
jgi:hypothetical protein